MEYTIIKFGAFLKWIFPAALGAGVAVWLRKDLTFRQGLIMFTLGTGVASILGGSIVEHYNIQPGSIQALMYTSSGIWGLGTIIQLDKLLPQASKIWFSKWLGLTNTDEIK